MVRIEALCFSLWTYAIGGSFPVRAGYPISNLKLQNKKALVRGP